MQEYIEMEKGKLEEAQKYLQDDQEVFEKMLKESEQKASAARQEVVERQARRKTLQADIDKLHSQIETIT